VHTVYGAGGEEAEQRATELAWLAMPPEERARIHDSIHEVRKRLHYGTINIGSMDRDGRNPRQHTKHAGGFDVQSPSLANGRIVYQLGADLRVYDIAADRDAAVPVRLVSDFDQMRDRFVRTPADWISTAHVSPNGDRVVFTARGQLFVVPAQQGRIVDATRDGKTRFREGRFFADDTAPLTLSDKSADV
jgi:tricorn protease